MNFCETCGKKLEKRRDEEGSLIPYCPSCGVFKYPVYFSAVSMVVLSKDMQRILLVQKGPKKRNILVAGYIDKGEGCKSCIMRELFEETALVPVEVWYNENEYFAPSNTLMHNYIVRVDLEEVYLNEELSSAKWFSLSEAKEAIAQGSLAERFLLLALSKMEEGKICLGEGDPVS